MTPRLLCVVAQDQPDLHAYLSGRFQGNPEVQVILDRRQGERRTRAEPHQPERRRVERRSQFNQAILRAHGLAIIRQE